MSTSVCRSRRSYVCDQCYRCKVKCSKEQPSCRRCQQANRSCTYSLGLWKGQPRNLNVRCEETIDGTRSKFTPPTFNDDEEDHTDHNNSMAGLERMDANLEDEGHTSHTQPTSQFLNGGDLQTLMFPIDPSIEWMEISHTSQPEYAKHFPDYGLHIHSIENGTTNGHGTRKVSLEHSNKALNEDIDQHVGRHGTGHEHHEHATEIFKKTPGSWSSRLFSPDVDAADITSRSGACQAEDRSPKGPYARERLASHFHPQSPRIERPTPLLLPPNYVSKSDIGPSRADRGQSSQQKLLQRCHPYQQSRSRSHSTDSLTDTRSFNHRRSTPASISRSISTSPLASTKIDESFISSMPEPNMLSDKFNLWPKPVISSKSSCCCLSSTISSLESLCTFSGELLETRDEVALLNSIRSALTVCDQVITCRCGRKCWAGLRCLLVIQEIYSHLDSMWCSAQSANENVYDQKSPPATTREISESVRTRQLSQAMIVEQVRGETMRAVMLLAGLELLQFPQTSRASKDSNLQGNSLNWKDIALDLSLKLKGLLGAISNE